MAFAFVDGSFVPVTEAKVSIFDRGFLFADGVYEVSAVVNDRFVEHGDHMARLERSLGELRIANPYDRAVWESRGRELVARNGLTEGLLYMQVTRGAPVGRDFAFPGGEVPSTAVMFTQAKNLLRHPNVEIGVSVVTVPDLRWKRRDIKSVSLLAQVLAKQAAVEAGANEAWMVENGLVTEGSSTSAFIVTRERTIVTRPLTDAILPGVTRRSILRLAREHELKIEERPFAVEEVHEAAEAFLTSAVQFVMPIVALDKRPIGDGRPGHLTRRLREIYLAMIGAC